MNAERKRLTPERKAEIQNIAQFHRECVDDGSKVVSVILDDLLQEIEALHEHALASPSGQPAPTCPHCSVPLTGMNSNPDECLHKPDALAALKAEIRREEAQWWADEQVEKDGELSAKAAIRLAEIDAAAPPAVTRTGERKK